MVIAGPLWRTAALSSLGDELGRLRRGRGVMASNLRERIGPTLRALSGIGESASP